MNQPEELIFYCDRCGVDDCIIGETLCGECMHHIMVTHQKMTDYAEAATCPDEKKAYEHLGYLVRQMHFIKNHFSHELAKDASTFDECVHRHYPNSQN